MDITTPAVYEHEIAKHDDFQYGFEGLIRNMAMLDRMLVSAEKDYIIGGAVTPDTASLGVRVGRMWGNGASLDYPIFHDSVSDAVPVILPVSGSRIDTVQVQAVLEEYDEQRRAFFNSETESSQYYRTPTKKRLLIKCEIKRGAEGQEAAPETDAGWLKLAEILIDPGTERLTGDNIRGVTAIYQNEENTAWTAEKTRTFILGSDLDLKTMLAKEHTATGEHRAKVIHAANIDFGVGNNQVNGKTIPLGQAYKSGDDEFSATDTLYASLVREIEYRRTAVTALAAAITLINGTIADMVHDAPEDGQIYGRRNRQWAAVTGGGGGGEAGESYELLKVFSKKTLMITNSRIVDRRKRGWDIGLPYLSPASRAYHFDTDQNDQNQTSNIEIGYSGETPALADKDQTNGQIYFNPAVLETVPHETRGRSLYGCFSLKSKPQTSTETATAEMWIRLFDSKSAIVLEFGSEMEKITFQTGTKGAPEAAYGTAEEDGILDGAGETPVACGVPEPDGTRYGAEESDGAAYGKAEDPLACGTAGTDIGNAVIHEALDGTREVLSLDDTGLAVTKKTWLHAAAVATPGRLSFFIGGSRIEFEKKSGAGPLAASINPAMLEFNLDELMLDETAAVDFDIFAANTGARIPWAGLDYTEKHFVLEAQDPALAHTNIFESEQFREAVYAAMDARP